MRALSFAYPLLDPLLNPLSNLLSTNLLKNATNSTYVGCVVLLVVLAILLLVLFKNQNIFTNVPEMDNLSDKDKSSTEHIEQLAQDNASFVQYLTALDQLKDLNDPFYSEECRTVDYWLNARSSLHEPLCDDISNNISTTDS